jgi:hypothetical protein
MRNVVIFLLVAIAIFLLGKSCRYIKNDPIVIKTIDTVYQEKTFTKYIKGKNIPYQVIQDNSRIDTVRDTITIVKDYLATKIYTDTFSIDSSRFTIIDTIRQNSIIGRQFKANLHEKTIRITNNIYHPNKNSFYLGILGDLRRLDNNLGIGVGIGYKTEKNDLFLLNITTNQYSVGYYKKIF